MPYLYTVGGIRYRMQLAVCRGKVMMWRLMMPELICLDIYFIKKK
jgi:hypothetical protein